MRKFADTLAGFQMKLNAVAYHDKIGQEILRNELLGSLLWDLGRLTCTMKPPKEMAVRRTIIRELTLCDSCASVAESDRWLRDATAAIKKLRPFVSLGGTAH